MKSNQPGVRYIYNGYDQVCNHLLEEYKKCAIRPKLSNGKYINTNCNNQLYLIEKICIPGKRKTGNSQAGSNAINEHKN